MIRDMSRVQRRQNLALVSVLQYQLFCTPWLRVCIGVCVLPYYLMMPVLRL